MSCSGCRVLRKGCSDACILRASIGWIEGPEAQGHATVFVAKFFGRAGLLSSLSSLPESHRPALFRSLLYEACGRAVNPVTGAVGLLWSGNWDTCEVAVETVLRGGIPRPMMDQLDCDGDGLYELQAPKKRERSPTLSDLDLCLSSRSPADRGAGRPSRRASTPSDESGMTSAESGGGEFGFEQPQLLNLFV